MAQLVTYRCPICNVSRVIWDTEYKNGWRCCYADRNAPHKKKSVASEDITQPVLYRLAGLFENRKERNDNAR